MHNRPNLPVGEFIIAPGPIMGSVDMIDIEIEGVGGHAASPHQTTRPSSGGGGPHSGYPDDYRAQPSTRWIPP